MENFRSAICTSCGSELRLDSTKKLSFCANCGSKMNVDEAIRKFAAVFPSRARDEESAGAQPPQPPAPKGEKEPSSEQEAQPHAVAAAPPPAEGEEEEDTLASLYKRAKEFLNSREYLKAADIYTRIINEIDAKEHAAHWGMFLVDERNFNAEEKLLQCFSCFPFRTGSDAVRREILTNKNLDQAIQNAPVEDRVLYSEEATRHADNIYEMFKEGIDGLSAVAERKYDILCGTFETVGITAMLSRVGYPVGVGVKFMSDKYYFQFQANRLNMLHLDILSVTGQPVQTYALWHYRNVILNPENGLLPWSEFRSFKNCEDAGEIAGELDSYNKVGYALLGLWRDKLVIRTGNKVFFCAAAAQPEHIQAIFQRCYETVCIPIVEDPNSYNTGHKSSEFYQVAPISESFDTARKSRWIRRKGPSACYIATAVYGGRDAPQVMALRRFRDGTLNRSVFGRALVRLYYFVSPPLAVRLERDSAVTRRVRRFLDWVVERIER
ncbi:MAG: hypothetical protein FWH16_05875 [Oscillospiraceae bacterium]|nr:hypothetical protein [Oscillospiraceae bacterium]